MKKIYEKTLKKKSKMTNERGKFKTFVRHTHKPTISLLYEGSNR